MELLRTLLAKDLLRIRRKPAGILIQICIPLFSEDRASPPKGVPEYCDA
jgi:hypothetical protein